MSVRIKTFRIENESAEQTLNDYLQNKIVRHWATSYSEASGTWNVLVAAEERENNREDRGAREDRNARTSPRAREQGGRGNDRTPREQPGRREPNPARQKAEPHTVELPDSDMPLYEAMRVWRNSRAREDRIKPFMLFNNKQLEDVVKTKPKSEKELRSVISDMSDEHFDKHKGELLGFIDGAASLDLGSQNLSNVTPNRDSTATEPSAPAAETEEKAEVNNAEAAQ